MVKLIVRYSNIVAVVGEGRQRCLPRRHGWQPSWPTRKAQPEPIRLCERVYVATHMPVRNQRHQGAQPRSEGGLIFCIVHNALMQRPVANLWLDYAKSRACNGENKNCSTASFPPPGCGCIASETPGFGGDLTARCEEVRLTNLKPR